MKNLLNIRGVEILNKKSQKNITAGLGIAGASIFVCHCGFAGGSGQNYPFAFESASINSALDRAGAVCQGQGASCQGIR